MTKEAVQVTFTHKVTRDELIQSLDRILHIYGCPGCGLNGWGGIHLVGDPDPFIGEIRNELINEKFRNVVNVEAFKPAAQINNAAVREAF